MIASRLVVFSLLFFSCFGLPFSLPANDQELFEIIPDEISGGWDASEIIKQLESDEGVQYGIIVREDTLWTRTLSLWVGQTAFVPIDPTLKILKKHLPNDGQSASDLLQELERGTRDASPKKEVGQFLVHPNMALLRFESNWFVAAQLLDERLPLKINTVFSEVPRVHIYTQSALTTPSLIDTSNEKYLRVKRKISRRNRMFHKVAYLTFDDGPSRTITPGVLDVLKQFDVRATFFVLGSQARIRPKTLRRIVDEGHSVGHHSYSHDYQNLYQGESSLDNFMEEVHQTDAIFEEVLGSGRRLLRAPGGITGHFTPQYFERLHEEGFRIVQWSIVSGDDRANFKPNDLVSNVRNGIVNNPEVVILFHDAEAKSGTLRALPEIIELLKQQHYELRALRLDTPITTTGIIY